MKQSFQKEDNFKSLAFLHPEMEDTGCLRLKADQVLPLLLQTSAILVNKGMMCLHMLKIPVFYSCEVYGIIP